MRNKPTIAILTGGGLTHAAGGIGQLTAYLLEAWRAAPRFYYRRGLIDTRGSGGRLAGVAAFAGACARLALLRGTGRLVLVHANMSTRGSAVRKCLLCRAAQSAGVPVVMHMHGADLHEFYRRQRPSMQSFLRTTLQRSARVLVLGAFWRDFLVGEVGVAPELVAVVPNGVPAPSLGETRSVPANGPLRIAFLGRLGTRKGVPELLEALASPAMRPHNWRATLAGDGEVGRFQQQAASLGLDGRIDLPGWLDRAGAASLLASADIFVLPSHHEGMPLSIIEALAHGVPVIATPVGSNAEFLHDGENALLVPAGDAGALADALSRMADDALLRQRLGSAGRRTFDERLAIGAVAATIAGIHDQAVRRKPGASCVSLRRDTLNAPG